MTTVIGRPAGHARFLARKAKVAYGFSSLGALLLVYGALSCYNAGDDKLLRLGALGGLVGAIALCRHASCASTRIRQTRAGISAEDRAARVLRRMGADVLVNGAQLSRDGDCDHLVLGPWAVAIETKSGTGRLSVRKGELHIGRKRFARDPIQQAISQAIAASQVCGTEVRPVVCVVGATNTLEVRGVTICGIATLKDVVRRSPQHVPTARARSIGASLTL